MCTSQASSSQAIHRLSPPERFIKARLVMWNCDFPDRLHIIAHLHRDELPHFSVTTSLANLALPALSPDTMTITEFQIEEKSGEWKSVPYDLRPPSESRAMAVRKRQELFRPTKIFVIAPEPKEFDPYINFLSAIATEAKIFSSLDAAMPRLSSGESSAGDMVIVHDHGMDGYAKGVISELKRVFPGKIFALAKPRKFVRLLELGYDGAYERITTRLLVKIHRAREKMRLVSM